MFYIKTNRPVRGRDGVEWKAKKTEFFVKTQESVEGCAPK
jgi:hypothetical protein